MLWDKSKYDQEAVKRWLGTQAALESVMAIGKALLPLWENGIIPREPFAIHNTQIEEAILKVLRDHATVTPVSFHTICQQLRVALTGRQHGLSIDQTILLLGERSCRNRIMFAATQFWEDADEQCQRMANPT